MSLDSCVACGHALAIADHRCRHCSSANIAGQRGVKGMAFYLLVTFTTLVFSILIYNLFLR
jgi:hypothetical protein